MDSYPCLKGVSLDFLQGKLGGLCIILQKYEGGSIKLVFTKMIFSNPPCPPFPMYFRTSQTFKVLFYFIINRDFQAQSKCGKNIFS